MDVTKNERRWPVLRAAQDIACDGVNPQTGRACVVGEHRGYHRDADGLRWLDADDLPSSPWEHG